MAGGKETPRQKMIGMMYLVLTALLAMNVSKSVLDSFLVINDGLERTNDHFGEKNELTLEAFRKQAAEDPAKFSEPLKVAEKVKADADELSEYIDKLKQNVIGRTEGFIPREDEFDGATLKSIADTGTGWLFDLHNVGNKDNYDVPTEYMIGSDETNAKDSTVDGSSLQLRMKIREYKEGLLTLFDPEKDAEIYTDLKDAFKFEPIAESDGLKQPWHIGSFYHLPLAAVVTNLTRMQAEVRNMEADAIAALMGNVDKARFKVDNLFAKVIPNTTYVMMGDSFVADIFVAASSSAIVPEVHISQDVDDQGNMREGAAEIQGLPAAKNGIVKYAIRPNREGEFKWGGYVRVKKPDGTFENYPTGLQTFRVAKGAVTVSPTAMNVFYRGLDNPVSVSAPGVATENLVVNMSNGSIRAKDKRHGQYIVKPGKGKECTVSVSGKIDGKTKSLGKAVFRVKNVPTPTPFFAGVSGSGSVSAQKLKAALGVIAKMENFQFDLKYNVISFSMSMMYKGNLVEKKASGNKLTGEMKTLVGAAKKGSKIYIENIKAKGPDGVKSLGSISIKVL
ncbi:MAG: hypothetical protein MRY83_02795 [Flavobacteriales bacterium]|nr:hypothetical protein [Flavobacteriales bacterium]